MAGTDPPTCYGCRVGPRAFERDHIAGRENLPLVDLPVTPNAHRRRTEASSLLGVGDWDKADGDLLVVSAYLLAGLATLLFVVAEWLYKRAVWLRNGSQGDPPPFPFPL